MGGTSGGPLAAIDKKLEVFNLRPSSGEINWQLYYGDSGAYEVSMVLATCDGGCLIAGTRWDWRNHPIEERDVILLKVNSQGQLVGIDNDHASKLTTHLIYPNPGGDKLYLECGPEDGVFEIYDGYGRNVISQNYASGYLVLDTSGLAKGMYYYRIIPGKKDHYTGIWVKE